MGDSGIPQPDVSGLPIEAPQSELNLQNASQAMTPQPQAPPLQGTKSGIKDLLSGFLGGMGRSMMTHYGLDTPEQAAQKQQQQAMQQQLNQSTIQHNLASADALRKQNETINYPVSFNADGTPKETVPVLAKGLPTLAAKQMQLKQNAQIQSLNAQLKARGIGGQIITNPVTGEPDFQPITDQTQLTLPQQATIEQKKQGGAPSEARLTLQSLRGDPEAKAALAEIQGRRMDLVKARGSMMNQRPLYMLQRTIENGIPQFMTGYQILQAQQEGRQIQPAGALSAKDVLTVQRLQSESKPAIEGVKASLGTYDNAADRAIYARVLSAAGTPGVGEESSWMGNIINQAASSGLSPQGQKQAVALRRLADTMGTMRSLMGLQATDQAMALTLSLLPGPNTPSAAYARDQVSQLEGMLKAAIDLPGLGAAKTPEGGGEGGGFTNFSENGKQYRIPNNLVPGFKKAHPNAR